MHSQSIRKQYTIIISAGCLSKIWEDQQPTVYTLTKTNHKRVSCNHALGDRHGNHRKKEDQDICGNH